MTTILRIYKDNLKYDYYRVLKVISNNKNLGIELQLWEDGSVVSITGRNFWLVGVTLAESSLASLEYNWLWSGKKYRN